MAIDTAVSNVKLMSKAVPHKRGCLFYLKRGVLALVTLIIVLPLTGFLYETLMSAGDDARFPPPGQLVNVDGRQMHIHCIGEGSPTIIFESGFGGWSDSWSEVQPAVGTFTRACSYDQAGLGWSASSSQPRTQEQIAVELHPLLATANIQPPYILVGHSLGGKSIRLFTAQHPEEVAGLVFIDARHESVELTNRTADQITEDQAAFEATLNLYRILRQTGVARLFAVPLARMTDPSLKNLPDELVYREGMFAVRETRLQTLMNESQKSTVNDDQLRSAQLPADLPVFVLTADSSLQGLATWEMGQRNLVALSSNSRWLIVKNSGHNIQLDQPQTVIDAVHAVFDSVNTGEPLTQ
jgi:pimeloyl-ACP methyl ester carboxylesterase